MTQPTAVEKTAEVFVTKVVNGAKPKRRSPRVTDKRKHPVIAVTVVPMVMKMAKSVKRPGEKLYILDESTVLLSHKPLT